MTAKPENERERIARIIDPESWEVIDHARSFVSHPTMTVDDDTHMEAIHLRDGLIADQEKGGGSLVKASAIIAQRETGEPVGWTGSGSLAQLSPGRDGVGYIWPTKDLSHPIALYLVPPPPDEAHARVEALEALLQKLIDMKVRFDAKDGNQADAYNAFVKGQGWAWTKAFDLLSGSTPKPARVEITDEKIADIIREHVWIGEEEHVMGVNDAAEAVRAALTAALTGASAKEGEAK